MVIVKTKRVKSQMSNTIKSMDYNCGPGPEPSNNQEHGVPRAIFIPHSNSLPFEERHITLEQPVKIGRNVYRTSPSPTNTIFECRVLSRHHATISYDKGQFLLMDNQSSNGTFVNDTKVSIKEKEAYELFSGDIVQFGISVIENAGNAEKNTFPPVVARLKLFHPDGNEAKIAFNPAMTTPQLKELYQLNNYVQEAIQREAALESRLRKLRECVESARAEAQSSWELFIGEQRLLLRVRTLESMLAAGHKPDQCQITQLLEDKKNYQEVAVESLRSAHERRLSLEESLSRRSREAAGLFQHNTTLRLTADNALQELQKLAARCDRKMCAARLAIAAAEEREASYRKLLPVTYHIQNGSAKMLVVSTDCGDDRLLTDNESLEDAIRSLPDYIKLMLPKPILALAGIKAVTIDGTSIEEKEYITKNRNIITSAATDNNMIVEFNDTEKEDPEDCSEENKLTFEKLRMHDELESSRTKSPKGGEMLNDILYDNISEQLEVSRTKSPKGGEVLHDNNANSEMDHGEDGTNIGQLEYANILRVMGGLNEEIKVLRGRLKSSAHELDTLRRARDDLLAAQPEHAEQARDDLRADNVVLQAQVARLMAAEEANLAEIQRLSATIAELHTELTFRPTTEDYDKLNTMLAQLSAKPASADKATDTDIPDDEHANISQQIDDMFRLDDEDDDDTESGITEVLSKVGVDIDDDERLRVTLHNGALHLLEEELVRVKEGWAAESAERSRLAARLEERLCVRGSHALCAALPVLAAVLCWLLWPHVS